MKTEKQLNEEAVSIRNQLNKIETARRTKENRKQIGRCYKYRNTYGGDCPGWWLYMRITGGGYWMVSLKFQHTSNNTYEVERDKTTMSLDGWTEITRKEFDAEWRKLLREIKMLNGSNDKLRERER